ncbi:hypothetical protein ACLMJK_002914 [Lecanora helva]
MAVILWLLLFILLLCLRSRYGYGLHKFQGPLLASLTDFWRFYFAYHKNLFPMRELHERYGDVVRIGPNALTFSNPQAVKDIFGAGKNWKKSDLYPVNAAVARGKWAHTLFSSADQVWHRNVRRAMSVYFTQTSIESFEPLIDSTINVFLDELDVRFATNNGKHGTKSVGAFRWLSYFAYDVMSGMTFSERYGFIQKGEDIQGIIGWVESFLAYGFVVGQMPWLDRLLRHNPLLMWFERQGLYGGNTFPGANFALDRYGERESKQMLEPVQAEQEDLLDKFRKAKVERPEHISYMEVLGLSLSTIIAGSEPTAIALTAVLYHVLRTPGCYGRLQTELDTAILSGKSTDSSRNYSVPHSIARNLPYLHACIQETFRVHPPFGENMERIVPTPGADICGHYVPAGTVVGCNQGMIHRHKPTFGDDVDIFRPERWLETPENGDMIRKMERTMFQFGAGNHLCLDLDGTPREAMGSAGLGDFEASKF